MSRNQTNVQFHDREKDEEKRKQQKPKYIDCVSEANGLAQSTLLAQKNSAFNCTLYIENAQKDRMLHEHSAMNGNRRCDDGNRQKDRPDKEKDRGKVPESIDISLY